MESEKIIGLLIKAGADVNSQKAEDQKAIIDRAVDKKNESIVRMLLNNGAVATPERQSLSDPLRLPTLLIRAVRAGNASIVQVLLEKGADSEIHTPEVTSASEKQVPLDISLANQNRKISRLLLEYGADPHSFVVLGEDSGKDYIQSHPFLTLASRDFELATLLLQYGAKVEVQHLSQNGLVYYRKRFHKDQIKQLSETPGFTINGSRGSQMVDLFKKAH